MAKQPKIIKLVSSVIPKRGEIYLVNFDPAIGAEIRKTRPALILQNDIANRYSSVTIVAAITSFSSKDGKTYPTEVFIGVSEGGLDNDSVALLNQIRTIDKRRLVKKLGALKDKTMAQVDKAVQISLEFGDKT
ncbi:MAG: mazF, mRNA interferase MazF [Parcubacteria group bacterium]|nr:mazF, mRNA interferase MazF [Parcubacteria group bacterium]